ncbi:MAG: amidohydrolase family protein [Gemmatimonadota bacterium]|nr:amidohydrolase family protein [Gemmatimonadota bacterium]
MTMNRRDAIRTVAGGAFGLASIPFDAARHRLLGGPESRPHAPRQPEPELLIRGGRVVNADGSRMSDVRIVGERITEMGAGLAPGPDARVIEAAGHLVMPGGIDPHAHLQGSFVDDLTSGTSAALAGGITSVGTFAYGQDGENAVQAMERWLSEVPRSAVGDVFFHASSWPPTSEFAGQMPELAALGQPSHKIFMTRSDFGANRREVIRVLEAARDAGVVTLMHCEDGAILASALERLRAEGRTSLAWYAESRPELAELTATQDATALCAQTGAPMHFVHLSSERALRAARDPAFGDLPLSIETRPLYLYFTEEWLRGPDGPLYVGQPPLRSARDVEAMWGGLRDGRIDMLATDHAPWTRAQKMDPQLDVGRLRPGVSDLRFVRPVLYSEGVAKGRLTPERYVEVTSTAAARAFGLYPDRGVLREGAFGDVMILDPERTHIVDADDDPSNSDYTPFQGWALTGWPIMTVRRGEVVYEDGRVTGRAGSGRPAERRPWGA